MHGLHMHAWLAVVMLCQLYILVSYVMLLSFIYKMVWRIW